MTDSTTGPSSAIGDDLGLGIALPGSHLLDSQGHRKVHPLSPLVHAVAVFPAMGGLAIALGVSGAASIIDRLEALRFLAFLPPVLNAIAAIALIAFALSLLVAAYQYLAWRALSFWIDDDGDLRIQSGVITRNLRRVQLSRIQAVDVTQPFAARLFSMAVVVVEVAGQSDSRVQLKFLTLADAREIRREVLARSAGLSGDTQEAPQNIVATVPPGRLAGSLILRLSTVGLLLATAVIIGFSYLSEGWSGIAVAAVTGGVPLILVVSEFIRYYGFTVAESPDGLRLKYGLLRTESRTVPPGRVQAIDYVEPFLWRGRGWARVRVTIAGVGTEATSSSNQQETLLLPVAPLEQAHDIVSRILPDLDTSTLTWVHAPRRAWKRSWIQWRNLAAGWDEHTFAIRRGRITRHLCALPHARTQSVRWTQGPWERVMDLATMHVDITPGPVTVSALHLDSDQARTIALYQADAARRGRRTDRSLHWGEAVRGSEDR
jgi:putative membrane protein